MSNSRSRSLLQKMISRSQPVVRNARPPVLPTAKEPRASASLPPKVGGDHHFGHSSTSNTKKPAKSSSKPQGKVSSTVGHEILSFEERAKLVEHLLAIPSIVDRSRRATVILQLRPEIKTNVAYSSADNTHVFNIVETCLQYPNGMQELRDILQFFEHDSLPMQRFKDALNRLLPRGLGFGRNDDQGPKVKALESQAFKSHELYIDKTLPPQVAILHVYADGSEQYRLWGHSSVCEWFEGGPYLRPDLALGEMVQHERSKMEAPEMIFEIMSSYFHTKLELRKWLRALHRAKQPYLIIADHTDFEIPWEMFDFYEKQYLGTMFATTRWQHIIGDEQRLWLQAQPEVCCGQVVAHVNHQELTGIGPELTFLEKLNALAHEDIFEFLTKLKQPAFDIGLVYIATHGFFKSGDMRYSELGSRRNKNKRLRLGKLRRLSLKLIKNSGSVIFINACHSGRLLMDKKRLHDGYLQGFAELFLSKGAKGVIATLGGVNDAHAAKTARHLIEKVLKQPTTPLSELLRQLRAEVVATLPDEPEEKDLLPFIYTFMYVYYGNPMTTLQLTKREG